jgi:hypothetical protein
MLIGHYAIALAAKSIDRKPALGSFFFATQLVDLVWVAMLILGLETVSLKPLADSAMNADILRFEHQPYSHSLVASLLWGLLFATWCYRGRLADGNALRALLLGAVVASHWWLDLLVTGPKVGAALWQYAEVSFWLELALLLICFGVYCLRTMIRPETKTSLLWFERHAHWWIWVVLLVLILAHLVSNHISAMILSLSQWFGNPMQTHALLLIQLMLVLTWIGLPVLAFLTLDRVRGARLS